MRDLSSGKTREAPCTIGHNTDKLPDNAISGDGGRDPTARAAAKERTRGLTEFASQEPFAGQSSGPL
jgi:hypothetical protein